MFLVLFSIFILAITLTENIIFTVGIFLILAIIILIRNLIHKIKNIKQIYLFLVGAFFLSLLSMSIKAFLFQKNYIEDNLYFIETGIVIDAYNAEKYVFQSKDGDEYLLTTENNYQAGDEVRINGYYNSSNTGLNNFFDLDYQVQNIKKISLSGFFNYQFDYPKRLQMKGFKGTLYESNSLILDNKKLPFISQIKKNLKNLVLSSYGENRISGLILGMLIGDRSQIPSEDYDNFISSSLVHIIAVSGQNIIMLALFLGVILFFIPFYPRNVVIGIFIIFYALLCGLDSSIFRATLMALLSMLAIFYGRGIDIWRSMAIVFIAMILFNPYFLIYDVGFVLSFSAIVGLVYFQEHNPFHKLFIEKKQSKFKKNFITKPIKEYLHPTLSATIGTFPIIIFFIGKINLLGIFANLLILPVVPFVMIYGFFSVYLFQIFHRGWILRIEQILVKYIYLISEFAVNHGIYISISGSWIKYIILAFFLFWFLLYRFEKKSEK